MTFLFDSFMLLSRYVDMKFGQCPIYDRTPACFKLARGAHCDSIYQQYWGNGEQLHQDKTWPFFMFLPTIL